MIYSDFQVVEPLPETLNAIEHWKHAKQFLDAELVYAARELKEKDIKKGYGLRINRNNHNPVFGRTVVVFLRGDGQAFLETYRGQKYIAVVEIIDTRFRKGSYE